ncbi:flagellar hook-basal body complex protein FliE [Marinibactrum halimedae]|uniref:flagellar hook-basal body complex protein FliE n=1 Tax=Marinibactrum halimedae TaxID=1444977 RepID=UPI0039F719A0
MTDRPDINQLLMNMRQMRESVQTPNQEMGDVPTTRRVFEGIAPGNLQGESSAPATSKFGDLFNQAIGNVNALQKTSGALAEAYTMGDENVDITDVMVASQKSSVAFQATVQVRNKMVEAYQDIMNMPM